MDLRILPPEELIETTIDLPLSKSISNRALIMNALTPGSMPLENVAACDDTNIMRKALVADPLTGIKINVGLAGTAMRFLTAYYACLPGAIVLLDGNERMRQRPIKPLVDALRACGASVEYTVNEGFPPLMIRGRQLHGGELEMDATVSSQFLSAILMAAPTFDASLTLKLVGEIASLPYLKMTIGMMQQRGIDIEMERNTVCVKPGQYKQPASGLIEKDWSSASYWYEIAALSAGWITLKDMSLPSLQGDSALAAIYEKLGIVTEAEDGNLCLNPSPEQFSRLDLDLSDTPDIAQTLAVTCCMLSIPFHFTGLESLKIKETDRLEALKTELAKLTYDVEIERGQALRWEGQRRHVAGPRPIETYGDHRMAMAFAPVALYMPGITIKNIEVVTKSYPRFWDDLIHAGFKLFKVTQQAQ